VSHGVQCGIWVPNSTFPGTDGNQQNLDWVAGSRANRMRTDFQPIVLHLNTGAMTVIPVLFPYFGIVYQQLSLLLVQFKYCHMPSISCWSKQYLWTQSVPQRKHNTSSWQWKKFLAFNKIKRFINVIITARHWPLFWARLIQYTHLCHKC
jgi:hypothetical protein